MAQPILEIRLIGPGLTPGQVSSQKIATVLDVVEGMIAAMVQHKDSTIQRDQVVLGLLNVDQGSLSLSFQPNLTDLIMPVVYQITDAIHKNNIVSLPLKVRSFLRKLAKINRDLNAQTNFSVSNADNHKLLATLFPDTEIPDTIFIQGTTTIYGEILRVGGSDPLIRIKQISGKTITCNATQKIAQKAGTLLYCQVELEGFAQWCAESYQLIKFEVTSITDVQDSSTVENFSQLCSDFSSYFDAIDPDQFIAELRYGD